MTYARLAAAVLVLAASVSAARADGVLDRVLGIISHSDGYGYTFTGWLLCTDPNVLGGCLEDRKTGYSVHQYVYTHLTAEECLAYINAAKVVSTSGGTCY